MNLDEKALEVLDQYDLEVVKTRKGRGVYFVETNQGLYVLKEHKGSEEKLEKLWNLALALEELPHFYTESPIRCKEGEFLTKNSEGKSFLLKSRREAGECDPKSEADVCRAMEGLAYFHTAARGIWEFPEASERMKYEGNHLVEELEKRTRELKKVQSFIRKKQKKNAFEDCYLQIVPEYLSEAMEITQRLRESGYENIRREALNQGAICHGEYTQHNVLIERSGVILINFEHVHLDVQCMDVALFLRKIMEKQGWKPSLGKRILNSYEGIKPLNEGERCILALCLGYPEKLWKVANHYYHTNKVWIPVKDLEKLKTFAAQQKERTQFVEKVIL